MAPWGPLLPGELSGSEDMREPEPECWWSEACDPVERSLDCPLAFCGSGCCCAAGGGSATACMYRNTCEEGKIECDPLTCSRPFACATISSSNCMYSHMA